MPICQRSPNVKNYPYPAVEAKEDHRMTSPQKLIHSSKTQKMKAAISTQGLTNI